MKTLLNIFSHSFLCTCHGLCGNYKSVPDTFQCISQIFFTDRISSGCINIIYSRSASLCSSVFVPSASIFWIGIPPRPILETLRPVFPSVTYSIFFLLFSIRDKKLPPDLTDGSFYLFTSVDQTKQTTGFILIILEKDILLFLYRFSVCRPG